MEIETEIRQRWDRLHPHLAMAAAALAASFRPTSRWCSTWSCWTSSRTN